MRLKKAIKKIVALGTGATMIGATLLGATAADLSNYPAPFVQDGEFDGKIVVGAMAAAQDVVGSIEIATGLQASAVTTSTVVTEGSSATVSLEGDSFKVKKSTDNLNRLEYLNDPVEVVTGDDLEALESGTVSNEHGDFDYDQFIVLKESCALCGGTNSTNASVISYIDSDQSDDPASYLWFADNYRVYTYRLSFPTALKSDVDEDDDLEDLENKKINMLGKEFTIIDTDNSTGEIELMGGAIQDSLQEYESKTYQLNGKEYEVEVVAISSTPQVIFKVNGEVTEKKNEKDTIKLSDGTELGIKTILENEGTETGGGDIVTFYLGASKVTLKDADWAADNVNGRLQVASDTVNNVVVDIVGTRDTAAETASISKIEIYWLASDDYYVPVGGKLSDRLESDEKDKLFLENLDFEFAALSLPMDNEIVIQDSGSDKYKVTFPTKSGGEISEDFFYVSASTANDGNISLGKSAARPFVTTVATAMGTDSRFSVSSNKYSHLLEVGTFDGDDNQVEFKDLGTGENFDVSVTGGTGTMYLDGYAYAFAANMVAETVTFTRYGSDNGGVGGVFYTPEEYMVQIATGVKSTGNQTKAITQGIVAVQEYKQEAADTAADVKNWINTTIVDEGTGADTTVGSIVSDSDLLPGVGGVGVWGLSSWDSKDDYKTGITKYGTIVEQDTSGDQDKVTLHIGDEAVAEVFITSGVTTTSTSSGSEEGTVTTQNINAIQVGSAILDSDVTDVTSDNYISVGGPCANSVSARLVGVAQSIPECLGGLALSEGEGVVKLFENGDKVSMLVAGATALDSQRASRVVANHDMYPEFTGMEVSVTGTSLSDITVSAPVAMDETEE